VCRVGNVAVLIDTAHNKMLYKPDHKVKVQFSRYRPGAAQRVGRGIALLFHDSGTRRGWVVCSTPRPHFTPGKEPVPILQEAGYEPDYKTSPNVKVISSSLLGYV